MFFLKGIICKKLLHKKITAWKGLFVKGICIQQLKKYFTQIFLYKYICFFGNEIPKNYKKNITKKKIYITEKILNK